MKTRLPVPATAGLIKRARHAEDPSHPRFVSQPELARRIGVSNAAVGLWETGRNKPQLVHLRAIAAALGVRVSSLLSDEVPGRLVQEPDTIELVEIFDVLEPDQRAAILAMARVLRRGR
jgi:transcriptional regulator with XRE-family HTH domain